MSSSTHSAPPTTHPAFPALIPSHLTRTPETPTSLPTSPTQVFKLINSCSSPHDIYSTLIPSLAAIASAKKSSEKDKERAMSRGEEMLAMLDTDLKGLGETELRDQTAGFVFVLSARMHPNHADQKEYDADLLSLASNLCMIGDRDQLNACGPRLADLAWGILRLAKYLRTPESALMPLQALLTRAVYRGCLSGVHAALLEACLLTRQYEAATEFIYDIYFNVKDMSPTYLDVLTFYHHAGLICAAIGRYEKAVEMFTSAVTAPTSAASAIQLSCAKRAILCGLLADGKVVYFPKYISGAVSRTVDKYAKEYVKLAEAFTRSDWGAVRGFIGAKEFKDDYNIGLVDQIMAAVPEHQIIKIEELYSRMKVSDLAARLDMTGQSGEAELMNLLNRMVDGEKIRARVQEINGVKVISFMEEVTDYTSPQALQELKQLNRLSGFLETELTKSGRELGVHREYLKKQSQNVDGGSKGHTGRDKGDDMDGFIQGGTFGGGSMKGKMRGVGSNMGDMGF